MKKKISAICAVALAVTLSGCGTPAQTAAKTDLPASETQAGATEATAAASTANSPKEETASAENKETEVPDDMEYVIENGITERMKALSTYIKGNRGRLAGVFKKAESGEKITVAYLGGSITQGSSAGDTLCYARLTTNWLEEKFPDTKIEYVRAGIGATGSYIGVHRADRDVLSRSPDLVFVDFSVNDTTENTERNINSYDSLIRKLWNSGAAVVTIAMTMDDGTSFQSYHSEICKAYDIPMISYREAILDVINKGHIKWTDISDDNIHPNVKGHAVLTELITAYLQDVINDLDSIDTSSESDISNAYTEDKYAGASVLTIDNCTPEGAGWEVKNENFGNFGGYWLARSADGSFDGIEPLRFTVEAKNIGVFFGKLTSKGCAFDVVIDGFTVKTVYTDFTGGWGSYMEAEEIVSYDAPKKVTVEIVPHKGSKGMVYISALAVS